MTAASNLVASLASARTPRATPVSAFQESLLAYADASDLTARYLLQRRFTILGRVEARCLEAAWQALTARHEILRSRYRRDPESGVHWRLADAAPPSLEYLAPESGDPRATWQKAAAAHKVLGFDLATEVPARILAVQLDQHKVAVAITAHHLIMDGWSFEALIEGLTDAYEAALAGASAGEAQGSMVSYADYEAWLADQDVAAAREYWRSLLAGFHPGRLEARAAALDQVEYGHRRLSCRIPATKLRELQRRGVSLATALNFAVAALASRYIGRSRLVWGNVVSLRPDELAAAETIIGPCIATIPVVADFGSERTLLSCLKELQLQLLESRQHAHLGLARIAEEAGHGALFDCLYTFQRGATKDAASTRSRAFEMVHEDGEPSSHFPLALSAVQHDDRVDVYFSFRKSCLHDFQATDFCQRFVELAELIPDALDRRVRDFDVLARWAGASVLVGPRQPRLSGGWLLQRFAEHVRKSPSAAAVIDRDGREYSYAELDEKSDQLAAALAGDGKRRATGIALPRSFELVVAVMGAIKADTPIVSIDCEFPVDRLSWICRELGVHGIVGPKDVPERLLGIGVPVWLTSSGDIVTSQSGREFDPIIHSDVLVVNHTSGSTGQPKLVLSTGAAHANRLAWLEEHFPAASDDVYCLKTKLAFAPALREILEPLVQGARLCVLPDEADQDLESLLGTIERRGITRIFLTPSFLRMLLDAGSIDRLRALRAIEISGEPLPADLLSLMRKVLPGVRLYNRYGATEAASLVYNRLDEWQGERALGRFCAVGRPIRNTVVSLVDSEGRVVPRGCFGEILLASDSVAEGYSSRAATEQERFSLVREAPGAEPMRCFHTQDQGFIDEGGDLYFADRASRMIKRAGFRIEPREVELALESDACVGRAVVVGQSGPAGTRLVAFVTPASAGSLLDRLALHAGVRRKLPAYLLPDEYVFLDVLPRTDSGKVDFVSLEGLLSTSKGASRSDSPSTPTEQALLALFREGVHAPELGVDDKLFDLGGDSLLALRLAHRINGQLKLRINVGDLYDHPSARSLAAHLDQRRSQASRVRHVLTAGSTTDTMFAFPPAGGGAHVYYPWVPHLPPHVGLQAFDPLPNSGLDSSVELIAAEYVKQIRDVLPEGRLYLAGWSLGGTIAYEVARQLAAERRRPALIFLIDPGFNTSAYDERIDARELGEILNAQLADEPQAAAERTALLARLLADTELVKRYQPGRYSGRLVLIKPREVAERERNFGKPFNGLEHFHVGNMSIRLVAGNHMTMMTNHGSRVCSLIGDEMGRVLS